MTTTEERESRRAGKTPGGMALGRGLVVLAFALLAGYFIFHYGNHSVSSAPKKGSTTTTSPRGHGETPTTSAPKQNNSGKNKKPAVSVAKPSSKVQILVANGAGVTGAAAYYSTKLKALGWATQTPDNATLIITISGVFYTPGKESDALAIAGELGLSSKDVVAYGPSAPAKNSGNATVVLVVGKELGTKVPGQPAGAGG